MFLGDQELKGFKALTFNFLLLYLIVLKEPDIQKLEEKIGMGQIEEVIQQVIFLVCASFFQLSFSH